MRIPNKKEKDGRFARSKIIDSAIFTKIDVKMSAIKVFEKK